MVKQQPELTLREHLEVLDATDRSLILLPRPGKSGQKLRARALRARNALALYYFDVGNVPQWAKVAFAEAETIIDSASTGNRPVPEGVDQHTSKVIKGFENLRVKTALNLKSYRNTIVRDARVNFIIEGELLRKRVREVIDPGAPEADVELAAWGRPTFALQSDRDWSVMTMPLPNEILSSDRVAASGFAASDFEPMQTALLRESFVAAARIRTAERCYAEAMEAVALSADNSPGLT